MPRALHAAAIAIVITLSVVALGCLWIAWKLWRQERTENPASRWRLRRRRGLNLRRSAAAADRTDDIDRRT
jgi:hypothetical protein